MYERRVRPDKENIMVKAKTKPKRNRRLRRRLWFSKEPRKSVSFGLIPMGLLLSRPNINDTFVGRYRFMVGRRWTQCRGDAATEINFTFSKQCIVTITRYRVEPYFFSIIAASHDRVLLYCWCSFIPLGEHARFSFNTFRRYFSFFLRFSFGSEKFCPIFAKIKKTNLTTTETPTVDNNGT